MDRRLRSFFRFFVLGLVVAVTACLPGARAPNVTAQRTLGLMAAEIEGRTSSAPFGVVFAGPKGETVDPSEVSIVWNRPMRPLELASDAEETAPPARITVKGGAAPAGKWRWLGTSALMFAPDKALPRATEYVVSVPGTTKALDGSVLGKDYVFSFSTPRPEVVHFSPANGATHLEPKQTFELRLNQPVDPKEVERATKISAFGGKTPIAFTASHPKADTPMLVKLTPKSPLPLDAPIVVAVDATLRGLEGPLPSGKPGEAKVQTYGPLTVSEISCSRTEAKLCVPHGSVHIELSNRVSIDAFKGHVRVEPPVPMKWMKGRDGSEKTQWFGLPVDLGPARSFRVVVTPGLKDEYGQTLLREHAVTLRTDDERPSTLIGLSGSVFEAAKAKGRDIPVSSMNVERFELVSGTTDELGLVKLLKTRGADAYATARSLPGAKTEEVRPSGPRNVAAVKSVSTDALLGPRGKGLVFVATSTRIPGQKTPNIGVQHASVTDLAITAKLSRFGSLALVTRLSDGKPVPGATVSVRDATGREVFSTIADGRGIALLPADRFQPVKPNGMMDEELVIFARSGADNDWTYRRVDEHLAHAETPYLDMAAAMPIFGMLFTDRGIYKTGETIRLKGVFRQHQTKGMDTPRGREITIRAQDPEGGTMFEHKGKLGAFGELAVDIPVPATSRLGRIQIDAFEREPKKDAYERTAASTAVEIAAYRAAEFKVAVDPSQPAFVRGDKATFTVRGDYLFGAPMSGGKVRYTVTRNRTSFRPAGLPDGFDVDDDAYRSGLADTSPRGGKIQGGDGALSDKGTFEAAVGLALPKQEGPENVTFEAEIEDLSRQTIASQATTLVHPAELYVALERPKELFVPANTTLRPVVAAVEPGGARRAGVGVQVELIARTWATATEATGDEGFHYESRAVDKVVGSCETKTTATTASCELRPSEAGFYIVRAKSSDKRGNPVAASYDVYVSGDARVAWPVYDGNRIELVTDKKSYEVGEVAKILVKSPFKEAEALLTVERQGVHKEERGAVRGSMPTFSVAVTAEMWPNVYVSVELLKGRTGAPPAEAKRRGADVGAPAYRIGWAEIVVNPEGRRLKVDVKPSKKELHPGDVVDVDLVVTDRAGKGTKADIAFYAVDEGVLMLTGYKTPDPLPVFSARRALSVASVESRDDLARIVRLGRGPGEDKGDEGGGGGADGMTTRQDFRTTAFFQPSVLTGPDGKAHVRFKLPDSLTTYRLMAVATSESDRFGFGQDAIVTSRPLMARPALPRFLRAGDAIDAGVILSSKNLPAQTVEVKLDVKGVSVQGESTRRVNVPANGSVEVRWPIGAPTAGKAELAFHARSPSARDDVTVKREVEVPTSMEAVALYGDTEKAVAERLGDLTGMRTDTGGLELSIASTALVGLDNGVEALLEYPYGCTEQLTSRMVPLVALGDLARDYDVKLPVDTNAVVDDTVAKILKAQRPDGAFGFWSDSPRGDTWLTAYALWGIHLARERGRPVPDAAIDGATRWLRARLSECDLEDATPSPKKRPKPADELACTDGPTLSGHAFVIDVLAMTGHADAGYATKLFERREKLPLFARALLAHAMTLTKMRPEDAKELVRDAEAHVRMTPAGATIAENLGDRYASLLDSDNRTTAIVLRTLVTIDPKHPLAARLAKGLLAARRGGTWRSTQENAWALLGLDAYRKAQEAQEPDFDALAFFGDQEVLKASFHGRSVKSRSATFAAEKIFGRAGQNLAFQVDGKGRLFYEARLRYARTTLPTAPLDRGFFVRKLVRSVKAEALGDAMRTIPQTSATTANTSDLVLVDLVVVTPDPREQVVIDDPLPAGLEPVQANLATTARDLSVTEPGDEGDEGDAEERRDIDERAAGRTFQQSWYHRELHDDRVLTFVDRMAAGMYHYRYLARATTPGRFVVPPTRAECMYEPETFGRTAATTFEVKATR